jgi:hypothetical protein
MKTDTIIIDAGTIDRIAMNILLNSRESQERLIWTMDWATETDSLNAQGQRMLNLIKESIIEAIENK